MATRTSKPSSSKAAAAHRKQSGIRTRAGDEHYPGAASWASDDLRRPARLVGALQNIERRRSIFLLTALSLILCCLIFPGVGFWPLAYVCLAPWLVCVCTAARARFLYLVSYFFGLGFFLVNIHWMRHVTWPGFIALSAYMAIYFPLAAWPIRHLYRRRAMPMSIVVPIVWIATEYLRSTAFSGFPWLLLAHTHYKLLTLIQISDLVGAYGVGFLIAMVNGLLTDLLIQPILIWRSDTPTRAGRRKTIRLPLGAAATTLVFGSTLVYGIANRSVSELAEGPRVAMVQHDIPLSLNSAAGEDLLWSTILDMHYELTKQAAAEKPDLIVLPETAMRGSINADFLSYGTDEFKEILKQRFPPGTTVQDLHHYQRYSRDVYERFQSLCTSTGIPIVVGSSAHDWKPTAIPPRVDAYNSAFMLIPGGTRPVARYDKQHLVVFSELVPCRYTYPWLYDWLNRMTPWGRDGRHHTLTPGESYTVFDLAIGEGRRFRAGTPICYEEIMPYINRNFVRTPENRPDKKNIDFLLSISNDGWFLHSTELEQHLAAAVFRAVENRVSIARSVNTGISGLVYPNGKIHSRVQLSDEKIGMLDAVTGALTRLRSRIEEIADTRENAKINVARQNIAQSLSGELRPALQAIGPEFQFIERRLSRLKGNLASTRLDPSVTSRVVLDQIDRDLATVERWRRRPWTAPGYVVDSALLDDRLTLYTRWGDWFAVCTVAISAVMLLDWFQHRLRRKPRIEDA